MKFQGASGPRRRRASLFWQSPAEHVESLHEHCRWCVLGGSLKAVASCLFLVGTLLHFLHLFLGLLKPCSTFQLLLFSSMFDLYCHNTSGIRPILMQHFLKMDTHNRASGIRKTQKEETREYMYLFVYVFIYLGFMVFV